MGHLNLNSYKILIALFFLLSLITCKNSSNIEFNEFIENKYNICSNSENCTVNLNSLPFQWDKLYIFSENHFPEALSKEKISSILGTKYNKNIDLDDRLIVFLFKGKIVNEILTSYQKRNFIDTEPLLVDFYLDKKIHSFFVNGNAKFIIKKLTIIMNYFGYQINN